VDFNRLRASTFQKYSPQLSDGQPFGPSWL
jgi:hypothetical protein